MEQSRAHRSLKIREEVCIGCSHCIKACPTEALRVLNGKALIYPDWCVDCGNCYRVCPSRAIQVVDDDLNEVFNYKYRVLMVSSVFYAQFENDIPRETIDIILGNLGFSEICILEQSVDTIVDEINNYLTTAQEKPVISSFCPSVVRMIQVNFPALLDRLMLVRPPLEATAQYYKKKYRSGWASSQDVGIFYLTPCIGKIAAVKSPLGGYQSPINGVINMDYIFNKIWLAYNNKTYDENTSIIVNKELSSKGVLWTTTGGESAQIEGRALSIDGMDNVMEFLEKLENDEVGDGIDYLELRACDESCAGGILIQNNRFVIANYLKTMSKNYPDRHRLVDEYKQYCTAISMDPIEPKSMVKYDQNIGEAIKKMEMANQLKKILPGIDCGACGAPSCEALSADIVREKASINNCIFMQVRYENEGSLTTEDALGLMSKVWGEDRFRTVKNTKKNKRKTKK